MEIPSSLWSICVVYVLIYFANAHQVGRQRKETSAQDNSVSLHSLDSYVLRAPTATNVLRNLLLAVHPQLVQRARAPGIDVSPKSAPIAPESPAASRISRRERTGGSSFPNVLMQGKDDEVSSIEKEPHSDDAAAEERHRKSMVKVVVASLVMQNSLVTLATKSTRIPVPGKVMYLGSAAVLASELIKLPFCLAMLVKDKGSIGEMSKEVQEKVFMRWKETLLMGVPALCYLVQNSLFFVALSNLSATSYQIWSQAKTLTTALFFVFYAGGRLRALQWAALALLAAGVSLVQFADTSKTTVVSGMNSLLGVSAVLASSLLSGFANAFLEKRLKKADSSLWIRNIQLGFFSIPQAIVLSMADMPIIRQHGIFAGFTPAVQIVVLLKAVGGLLTAGILKYANNIVKTYATAVAIIVTCLLSIPLYGTIPSTTFLQGMTLVIASIIVYNSKPKARKVG